MKSLAFPAMFKNSKMMTYTDRQATMSNLSLLLQTSKNSLFGDPYYGTNIMNTFYAQNHVALDDILIDDIYTAILEFMPQLNLTRNDITIKRDKLNVTVEIRATNMLDQTTDMYSMRLMSGDSQGNQL